MWSHVSHMTYVTHHHDSPIDIFIMLRFSHIKEREREREKERIVRNSLMFSYQVKPHSFLLSLVFSFTLRIVLPRYIWVLCPSIFKPSKYPENTSLVRCCRAKIHIYSMSYLCSWTTTRILCVSLSYDVRLIPFKLC